MTNVLKQLNNKAEAPTKPLLKWAGGKSQLLDKLLPLLPKKHGKYIEPFFGGGALFFAHKPGKAVIADSNPELVNLYRSVADNVQDVIKELKKYKNTEEDFYLARSKDWTALSPAQAAARTIFLNRTCFNGLYRVNRKGQFNVPYGKYKNPKILDEVTLLAASSLLKNATIICADYKKVLAEYALPGDVVFLDPPYLPVSQYSDFKRYTKEQFYEEDHIEMAAEIMKLHEKSCHVILTNSNHPLMHELYHDFPIDVIQTRRYISAKPSTRKGEDIIINIPPQAKSKLKVVPEPLSKQVAKYPPTRYMGSKNKLLADIWKIAARFEFETAVDLFSGSGIVGYMFKAQGKTVLSNDYMNMSATFARAMIENNTVTLSPEEAKNLTLENKKNDSFVSTTFKDLYFSDEDNLLIDNIRANIKKLRNPYKKAIAISALMRASVKKRPRGIFTYIGHRYDDGRKDLTLTFYDQFLEAVSLINASVFDNKKANKVRNGDALAFPAVTDALVYIDPPYYSPFSDNEYVRRYHFTEGLARDWQGVEIQEHTITKKFKSYPTPFSSRKGATEAFDLLFRKFQENILLVSYSSNSLPTLDEMVSIMAKYKKTVEVIPVDYKYSIGNQGHKVGDNKNEVKEYLFVGF